MKLSLRSALEGAARTSRGALGLMQAARAHVWGSLAGRALLAAGAITMFAVIGRSAIAGANPAPVPPIVAAAVEPLPIVDAGVTNQETPPSIPAAGASRASPDDPVVLNTATLADLQRLPGVGEKRAQSILALRTRLGRFRQIEDLLKVKGIGRATLKRLRPMLRIDPAAPRDAG